MRGCHASFEKGSWFRPVRLGRFGFVNCSYDFYEQWALSYGWPVMPIREFVTKPNRLEFKESVIVPQGPIYDHIPLKKDSVSSSRKSVFPRFIGDFEVMEGFFQHYREYFHLPEDENLRFALIPPSAESLGLF